MHQQHTAGRPGRTFSDQQLDQLLGLLEDEENFVFLESARLSAENRRSLLFARPLKMLTLRPGTSAADFLAALEAELQQGHYLAGWFAYEFGYLLEPRLQRLLTAQPAPLAVLGVYAAPLVYDHERGSWDDRDPAAVLAKKLPVTGAEQPLPSQRDPGLVTEALQRALPGAEYRRNVRRIKEYIAAGDTYQVNYTFKQQLPCRGSAAALYCALRRNQRVSYAALLNLAGEHIISLSPELFLRRQGDYCTVRPMKGTSRRGLTPEEDARWAAELPADRKNRSENVMIVDLLRNDLGRICRPGTVETLELFTLESYETLYQLTSTIRGELKADTGLAELFKALFPCGSVTGAPKIRTMEIIHELEQAPRGVYTGAIGFISPEQEMVFNVPIRTVTLDRGVAEMGIGSGVVYDSDPEQEWRECKLKGNFLSRPTPPFVLIETMLWQPDQGYRLLELHLQRLLASAQRLAFEADPEEIRRLLAAHGNGFTAAALGPQRVRLTLAKDGTLALSHAPFAGHPCFSWQELVEAENQTTAAGDGPKLPTAVIAPAAIDPDQPLLYHKTSQRDIYDRHREAALAAGHCEALFVNTRGELTEGAVSNLFIRHQGRLLTPPVSAGLLNGVLRRHLLTQPRPRLQEQNLRPADLATAEAVFIGNSLRGLTRIRVVEE
ncbi:aminodeoxychorismate synthase component I [Desulfurivibrio alkaliphilus]|uniref:Para-aminobenzoate synthase, subunit I n=1 Tax=Desulfurivibrio alkaliphilus (strain DSM 19089 / UNIQEM U267 / AHT2) TaxID=589865 RepID=D6Z6J6_DESAT|nr:aminodeoxychorismate synthase component I [Desulfurivibrio alkaliphilus]ADH84955.1 para-aminobenzoate synthase, subunit I [Desulfurivibrio alkaliphilus AHT 2]